jgi:hypothetical protein
VGRSGFRAALPPILKTRAARLLGIQRLALARAATRLGITTGRIRVRSG